ncbi:hypothetical protein [Halorubellus sp. PRR65]|uniref:hypothetical protein n=1 Tax=Halorubellus sp. PRR65 TaxID=3098148 RepID=UPI002B259457|nr:hypothetical protein [Halorubellus sp. PRR65]
MSAQTGSPRYIIYLNEACDQLEALDKSLEKRIRKEARKFLTAWNATDVFDDDKTVTKDVDYIKRDRGATRGFGSYIEIGGVHLLIVLAVFKEDDKGDFWLEKTLYQSKVAEYQQVLDEENQDGAIESYIENLRANEDYLVIGPDE